MARTVFIDVAAKLENWMADSVVAMTNGGERVLIESSQVKRDAREWLEESYPRRRGSFHVYMLLAILVSLIVSPELDTIDQIVVDDDYPGTKADRLARQVFVQKNRDQHYLTLQEIQQAAKQKRPGFPK